MIYAVLLCNKEWNIVKIKQNVSGLSLKPGDCLADVVQDADELTENDEKQYSLFLTFRENGMTLSTLGLQIENTRRPVVLLPPDRKSTRLNSSHRT